MLVLTRKVGERIIIGDDIVITVTKIQGNRIQVAIEAPANKKIIRGETSGDGQPKTSA
jgi:carbon storage regulator